MDHSTSRRLQRVPPPSKSPSKPFTPAMRARQARGQDPYQGSEGDGDRRDGGDGRKKNNTNPWWRLGGGTTGRATREDDVAEMERRDQAVAYLNSPELLMMYAQSTGDSIPAARLHFMKVMCGYEDKDKDDGTRGGGKAKGKGRGKKAKRSSTGAAIAFARATSNLPESDGEGVGGGTSGG